MKKSDVIGYLFFCLLGAACMTLILLYPIMENKKAETAECPQTDWQISCEEEIEDYASMGEDAYCLGVVTDMYEWVDELDDEGKKWHDAFRRCELELRVCKVAVELKVKDGQ